MKRVYESPVLYVEEFVVNSAVSTCTLEGDIDWDFDCMYGPDVDTESVVASNIDGVSGSCTNNIGYAAGITVARDYSGGFGHSNNNSSISSWTKGSDNGGTYRQVAYTGAQGLLYTDYCNSTADAAVWSVQSNYVKHSSSKGGNHHMVAPVLDARTINASW